jgi:hypothetical protein
MNLSKCYKLEYEAYSDTDSITTESRKRKREDDSEVKFTKKTTATTEEVMKKIDQMTENFRAMEKLESELRTIRLEIADDFLALKNCLGLENKS